MDWFLRRIGGALDALATGIAKGAGAATGVVLMLWSFGLLDETASVLQAVAVAIEQVE